MHKSLATLRTTYAVLGMIASILLSGCDQDKSPSISNLQGTRWNLQATINSKSGELTKIAKSSRITLTFSNEYMYEFKYENKNISAQYVHSPKQSRITCFPPAKVSGYPRNVDRLASSLLSTTEYELIGSTLKLVNANANDILIFERIK